MKNKEKKVLIVDDERYNINILADILKSRYKTIAAKNGEQALKRAMSDNPPDLILLDIMMPEMDGYEVCRRLKADVRTRDIPVIFITAMSEVEDEARGLEAGAIDYITKPVSPPIVRARVRNQLALKMAHQELEEQKIKLEEQNKTLIEAASLREDVERITRHDLKTPLNAIIGFSRVLMTHDNMTEAQLKYLKMVRESGLVMLRMINRSLDIFKMERGIYSLNPASLNILKVIGKVMNEMQTLAEQKQVTVNILINGNPPSGDEIFSAYGEELLCYSMLANLIGNAVEASPNSEAITIDLINEAETAVIRIHNKGVVPEDIRENFFGKYVTSGKESGTGLGTYSARLIAETQGGSIGLETSEEKGSTVVTIRLPSIS